MNTKFNTYIMKEFTKQNGIYLASEAENAQWEKDHTLVCPICGKTFIGYGNNPYPIMKDGKCCDDCNLWVILMRIWLGCNHDTLESMVDKLYRRRCTVTSCYCISGKKGAFTFYRDAENKKLDVVVACDDECCEKVLIGTLRNWIALHCSDKDLKGLQSSPRFPVWVYTNQVKKEYELKAGQSA